MQTNNFYLIVYVCILISNTFFQFPQQFEVTVCGHGSKQYSNTKVNASLSFQLNLI